MSKITLIVLITIFLSQIQSIRCEENSTSHIGVPQRYSPNSNMEIVKRRLANVWNLVSKQFRNPNPDTFIGRCIGAAKGLKVAMPLIIFKLGVIVTIVSFLAIFSMKTIGLLITLLIFNITGVFSKFAYLLKHDDKPKHLHSPPQTVHFHLHNKEEGGGYGIQHHYTGPSGHAGGGWTQHTESSDYGGGWAEKNAARQQSSSGEMDQVELQNLYKRLGITKTSDGRIIPITNNYEVRER